MSICLEYIYSCRCKSDSLAMCSFFDHVSIILTPANMLFCITDNEYVVFGGGHAATIAVRATKNGFLKPKAIAAVAPTWAGPLPIVFGRDSNMETR